MPLCIYRVDVRKDEKRSIIGAEGAIPYIQNLPLSWIERFREQVTLVDLIGVVDEREVAGEVASWTAKRLPAFRGPELDFSSYRRGVVDVDVRVDGFCGDAVVLDPERGLIWHPENGVIKGDSK